jgi:glucose-6-phosphate isomerase
LAENLPLLSPAGLSFKAAWNDAKRTKLTALFAADPQRVESLTIKVGPILFDLSKTHLSRPTIAASAKLLKAAKWDKAYANLLGGGIANSSENRAALHTAMRSTVVPDSVVGFIKSADAAMKKLVERIRSERKFEAVVQIGIGGSTLGPELAVNALAHAAKDGFEVRFCANVDGQAFENAVRGLNPARTLFIMASKSWTTLETQMNLDLALASLESNGIAQPKDHVVALTARPDLATAWGLPKDRLLPMADWVGGRYSVWSSIGLPLALQLGWSGFQKFRAGARLMDEHARDAPLAQNAVLLHAAAHLGYAHAWGRRNRAIFAYDERLRLLVNHISQVELESLGKSVSALEGRTLPYATTPVLWGGTGTDAQHAVFQMLHQGTEWCPVDFVAIAKPAHPHRQAHRALLANCFAQSAALMTGQTRAQAAKKDATLAAHKVFPGNRPSTTILLDALTPEALGALIAFYEQRTFALGLLWGLNPFDQMGVELGKVLTKTTEAVMTGAAPPDSVDPSTRALIAAVG